MVAYSFKPRFAGPILAGAKAQTVRAHRRRHARPGEQLQLYTGMRTKHRRLISTVICESVEPVRLTFNRSLGPLLFIVGDVVLSSAEREAFAQADGFGQDGIAALDDMSEFWFGTHGRGVNDIDFRGVVIRWQPLDKGVIS